MRLKEILWLAAVIIIIILVGVFLFPAIASAGDGLPEGTEVFSIPNAGLTCVVWPDGSGECYCDCIQERLEQCGVEPTSIPTGKPPTSTPVPTNGPEATPTNPPPDTPEPPDKEKCNRGIGNNSEGCDPGNSSGQGRGEGRDAGEDRDENKKGK